RRWLPLPGHLKPPLRSKRDFRDMDHGTTESRMRLSHLLPVFFIFLIAMAFPARALEKPLPMAEAFVPSVMRGAQGAVVVQWKIAPGYYLYREYLSAKSPDGQPLNLETLPGEIKDDPGFGKTEVYYTSAAATVTDAPQAVEITYQGCQDGGLCYT